MARITINGVTVDPMLQAPSLAAADLVPVDASKSDFLLIQTREPLGPGQKAELAGLGVVILEYVPESTYIAGYRPADLGPIRGLAYVSWVGVYLRGFKLAPALLTPAGDMTAVELLDVTGLPTDAMMRQPRKVDVVLQNGVPPESVREKVANAAHLDAQALVAGSHKFRITVQQRYLKDLAAIDEVRHIEDVVRLKLHNNIARGILGVNPIGVSPFRLEGQGQIVAIADTGFDKGSTTDVHPAFTGRVLKLYPLGRPDDPSDPDGHGTHVTGSLLGDGDSPSMGGPIRGTAPQAKLVLQSVLDASGALGGLPADLGDLFGPPYNDDNARVHSNSWGSTVGDGTYDANAREVDDFVANHRDLVICFAAGNSGVDKSRTGHIDPGSVGAPSTAKNCITVGATENLRPDIDLHYDVFGFPARPFATDLVADNPEGMAAFSGRGPTTDQRIKPDVVAPGTSVLSTRSRAVATPSTDWGTSLDPAFFFEGGTSMATPLVAGCATLVREFLVDEQNQAKPSAALVKALLINGAVQIAGQYSPPEVGNIPDFSQGFGRVDVPGTVGPHPDGTTVTFQDEGPSLDTGQQNATTVTIPDGATALKVTLVWTDPAGEALQNDLDLIVQAAGGGERHGNVPATSTAFDRTNNVEQVLWANPPAGDAQVIVKAFRVAMAGGQTYALVIRVSS